MNGLRAQGEELVVGRSMAVPPFEEQGSQSTCGQIDGFTWTCRDDAVFLDSQMPVDLYLEVL